MTTKRNCRWFKNFNGTYRELNYYSARSIGFTLGYNTSIVCIIVEVNLSIWECPVIFDLCF